MCGERPRTPWPVRAARSCQRPSYSGGQVPAILRLVIRALRRARLAPLAAAVALFATMPITVSSLLHDEMDDAICNPAVVVHDATAHRIGAAADALPDSQHCVLCHTLQSPPRCGLPDPRWTRASSRARRPLPSTRSSARVDRPERLRSPHNANPWVRSSPVGQFAGVVSPYPRTREPANLTNLFRSGGFLCGRFFYVWPLWP